MKTGLSLYRAAAWAALVAVVPSLLLSADDKERKPKAGKADAEIIQLTPFEVSGGGMSGYAAASTLAATRLGATAGGTKDANYIRAAAHAGQIPHPNTITAEGLFSEHDLPLDLPVRSSQLITAHGAASPARFEVLPNVRYLAQLGLSTRLDANTWHRSPLNVVFVVDKSGSMEGDSIALVRDSLHEALGHLSNGDQMSIVIFDDQAQVLMPPTAINGEARSGISAQIDSIEAGGATSVEAGLRLGFRVARESLTRFSGTTRVIIMTDERPNVGNTEADGFMAMAKAASRDGIGLTTIGVGVQFGAELATTISSVRGGNLFFFPDRREMRKTFAKDFDTLVTELAYDLNVRIEPATGYRIDGVFGVPGRLLRWDGDALELNVTTLFLSRRKGAIFFALSPRPGTRAAETEDRNTLATVSYRYRDAGSRTAVSGHAVFAVLGGRPPVGLRRGVALVDEYLTVKKAAQAHLIDNNQEAAYQLLGGLKSRLDAIRDRDLNRERKFVDDLFGTIAMLSGHAGGGSRPVAADGQTTADGDCDETDDANVSTLKPAAVDSLTGLPMRGATTVD